jgi:hypothetical protein
MGKSKLQYVSHHTHCGAFSDTKDFDFDIMFVYNALM